MSRQAISSVSRGCLRALRSPRPSHINRCLIATPSIANVAPFMANGVRNFTNVSSRLGAAAQTPEQPPTSSTEKGLTGFTPAELSESQYHDIADEYLENVLTIFEALQDSREDIDIEFSSGVMTITHNDIGTYVINKQPPNKQIWLSSPISGPKRYDWCVEDDSQQANGHWMYSRDNSSLDSLILEELGVDISMPAEN
ncbi:Putative Frataxin-like protein [[Torrubiella] hemipterigena]|uniref:ferroxidase n=1 Tax=[Torrubiella] hemipterigena TaxID=1531966 RepID=A0A0A1SIJ4_9HYPO|nr:Putative Frataxin-like protein [[Torrubiella] hemipterigena]